MRSVGQFEQSLHLPDDLAAGSLRAQALPKKGPEGALLGVNAIAAVGRLGKERIGQSLGKAFFEFAEGETAHGGRGGGPPGKTHSQLSTPGGKEGSMVH